jgi:hypothetical protein
LSYCIGLPRGRPGINLPLPLSASPEWMRRDHIMAGRQSKHGAAASMKMNVQAITQECRSLRRCGQPAPCARVAGSAQPKSRLTLSVKVLVAGRRSRLVLAAALAAFLIDGPGPSRALNTSATTPSHCALTVPSPASLQRNSAFRSRTKCCAGRLICRSNFRDRIDGSSSE